MRDDLGDKQRLQHIFESLKIIEGFVANKSFNDYDTDLMLRMACERLLEIIGEASNHITDEFKEVNPIVEWRKIVGLRNILVHEYFAVSNKLLWSIITENLPELRLQIEEVLKRE